MTAVAQEPFVVAHRAGNDLELLRCAARARSRVIEADVHLYAGRLEVRHLKTLGPFPVLWDRAITFAPADPATPFEQKNTLMAQPPTSVKSRSPVWPSFRRVTWNPNASHARSLTL